MGSAAAFGAGTALLWGVSDVFARLAGRATGVLVTTFMLMVFGSILMVLYAWVSGTAMSWDTSGYWLIAVTAIGMAIGTLLTYAALTRGPVSLASPAVASYPAISVPISLAFGAQPDVPHWVAMAGTMAGVWLVARAVRGHDDGQRPDYGWANVRVTLLLSGLAAVIFALSLLAADIATDRYGWAQTLIGGRMIGAVLLGLFIVVVLLRARRLPKLTGIPTRTWPLLVLIGILDTAGNAVLYAGLGQPNGEYAIVASVAYTAVTTVIARLFLREPVALIQWLGIGLIIGGVGALAATG